MKKLIAITIFIIPAISNAQVGPEIYAWIQDTVNTGSYYVSGNSNTINNNITINCQRVEYDNNFVYVTATGVPAYPTGPFLDGNPSQAQNQSAKYAFPRNPSPNTGTPTATTAGKIGIFINGVSLYDYRDGVAWNPTTSALCGGPGNPPCPGGPSATQDWNRDAIPAEMAGFDCSKGHPAMGDYHHHQNPSAFKLDKTVVSTICNLYDADGLYKIDSMHHSPLIGFAFDGYPIYGAYAYKNTDGTGGIVRMKSAYQLRNITTRTTSPTGATVGTGPNVNSTYFLGYFREDYEYVADTAQDVLDEHNGRFCITPEYPAGTYAYFATVDQNWNSAYPYAVGPTFYGNYANRVTTNIPGGTTRYLGSFTNLEEQFQQLDINVFPNPTSDIIAIQVGDIIKENIQIELRDVKGKLILEKTILAGSTIAYFDVQTLYSGVYMVQFVNSNGSVRSEKIIIQR